MHDDIVEDPAGDQVYFNQLGGHAAVTAVISDFLNNVVNDTAINHYFVATDAADLQQKLIDQVCEATGGYCTYQGGDMLSVHTGMCISTDDFNAMVGDLLTTFDTLQVPYTPVTFDGGVGADALILVLAGMATDIVEDPENDGCN
jgi:hemoglobin